MGMNYYWYAAKPCSCCHRPYEPVHIGKSSYGWVFLLHVIPEEGIANLDDWKFMFSVPGSYIIDETDREVSAEEMLNIITNREYRSSTVPDQKFLDSNYAMLDNGLLRFNLHPEWCIGHGEGPWDLITGEFS